MVLTDDPRIRLLIADDHAIVRTGFKALVARQPDMIFVGEAHNAEQLLAVAEHVRPDILVVDLQMPGGGSLEAIRELCQIPDGPRAVVFTAFESPTDVLLAFRAGASAYVVKGSNPETVITAIRAVHRGQRYLDPTLGDAFGLQIDPAATSEAPAVPLSPRETQILELIAMGHTNKEMADRLGIGVKSVETYRFRVTEKLGLRSRAEVTHYVLHSGILEQNDKPKKD